MKSLNYLQVVIAGLLLVTAVSCTSSRDLYGDEGYARQSADRILVEDPYYGTIVMERDPFTGRYYQVGTLGMSPYGSRYGYGRNVRNNPGYYHRRPPVYQRPGNSNKPAPSPAERAKVREDARKKVLGN